MYVCVCTYALTHARVLPNTFSQTFRFETHIVCSPKLDILLLLLPILLLLLFLLLLIIIIIIITIIISSSSSSNSSTSNISEIMYIRFFLFARPLNGGQINVQLELPPF